MISVFTLTDLVKYIIFIGIIYGLMIIIPSQEISKINLILIVSIIYIGFILLDCLNNNSESFSDTSGNTGSGLPINNVTAVTAIAGNGQANVTWTIPTNNSGSDISSYVISSYVIINNVNTDIATIVDASSFLTTTKMGITTITPTSTATATTVNGLTTITATVLGLINGTSYTFTVRLQNQAGLSPATIASTSNLVTPTIENNIMLYVTILGGFIVGIFLLYLVMMLFNNNNPDNEVPEEEVEEVE
jgi:hypothetical protein